MRRPADAPRPLTGLRRNGSTNRDHGKKRTIPDFFPIFRKKWEDFPNPDRPWWPPGASCTPGGKVVVPPLRRRHAARDAQRTIGRRVSRAWPAQPQRAEAGRARDAVGQGAGYWSPALVFARDRRPAQRWRARSMVTARRPPRVSKTRSSTPEKRPGTNRWWNSSLRP